MSLLTRIGAYPINDAFTDVEDLPPPAGGDGTAAGGPAWTAERREKRRRASPECLGGLSVKRAPAAARTLAEARARTQPGSSILASEP